ncbi:MAG: hypothetical protein LC768_07095 [Acidobacteria bacterium]|nr:hypothetical protein [Acidobacteriota bacterium]MCA1638089.1 hypothetical protein [Acidobacteriota bacterium]
MATTITRLSWAWRSSRGASSKMAREKVSRTEQVIGREAETATFIERNFLSFGLSLIGFRPRQCRRSAAIACKDAAIDAPLD